MENITVVGLCKYIKSIFINKTTQHLYLNMLIKMDQEKLKQMTRTEEMLALNKV